MLNENYEVSIQKCPDYNPASVRNALENALQASGTLPLIKEGMKIAVKVNLVTMLKPEAAATTHPVVVEQLCKIIIGKGAVPVVGDGPGGVYNAAYLGAVYSVSGMTGIAKNGITLNKDFSQKTATNPDGKIAKEFIYTGYLDNADMIINVAKFKTHGMMGFSGAVKNMFGTVPGAIKPEYHYKYPNHQDFADMLIDLNEYFKPSISIIDGVIGMEGNGPTSGTPRKVGIIAASASQYKLDLACTSLIGLKTEEVPTLQAAFLRGLAPLRVDEISIDHTIDDFIISDYELVPRHNITFDGKGASLRDRTLGLITRKVLRPYPSLKKGACIGCGKCFSICPAKAIEMKKSLPAIKRDRCIYCFCCQEFCPAGAMTVKEHKLATLIKNR